MSQKKYKKKQSVVSSSTNYALFPLVLVIFLVPLIMRAYIYDSGLSGFAWYPDRHDELDIFLYWKSVFLEIIAALMTVILAVKLVPKKTYRQFKKDYWIYFLIGYGALALISTIASPYRSFGFSGIYEQFESIWVILSYCVITLYAYCFVQKDEDLRVIRKALFFLLLILICLGVTQLLGKDFFESDLGRKIIIPEKLAFLRENLTFTFSSSGIHQVYLTFYNPNYVGVFAALICPITVILVFASRSKIYKIIWAAISLAVLVCTFGSGSKTFLISLAAVALVALFFLRKPIIKHWILAVAGVILILTSGAIYFSRMNVNPVQYVKNAMRLQENAYRLEDIEVSSDKVLFYYNNDVLKVQYTPLVDGVIFFFQDGAGNLLEHSIDETGNITVSDERFSDIRFVVYGGSGESSHLIGANFYCGTVLFTLDATGYHYVTNVGKVDEIANAPSAVFTKYDRFASGRGYIWSRSIPLLKKHFFLGSGADTFVMTFPQNDYIGRMNSGYGNQLITKPHNLYLQIGVQHGVLALISFLCVCVIYFVQSCRIYWRSDMSDSRHIFGVGLMLGVIGYLIAGVANDSCVALAPLFWAILGIGFAVNRMNRKEMSSVK